MTLVYPQTQTGFVGSLGGGGGGEPFSGYLSVGVIDIAAPSFVDNEDGSITIDSCNVALYDNPNATGELKPYNVPSATLSFTDGAQEYVVVSYNSGSPVYSVTSNITGLNGSDNTIVYFVWRVGNKIHSSDQDSIGLGFANKMNKRTLFTEPYKVARATPFSLAETTSPSTRTITCSAAKVFKGVAEEDVLAFNSSTDNMYELVSQSTGWVYTKVTRYDNQFYNPYLSNKTLIGSQKWAYRLFYRSIGNEKDIFYVMSPTDYVSDALARDAALQGRSDIPLMLKNHCIWVGYSVIKTGASTGTTKTISDTNIPFDSSIINDYVVQTGTSGRKWYRKYKSGFIEQGGYFTTTVSRDNQGFLTPFSTTDYIMAFSAVCTTSGTELPNINLSGHLFDYKITTAFKAERKKDGVTLQNFQTQDSWYAAGY